MKPRTFRMWLSTFTSVGTVVYLSIAAAEGRAWMPWAAIILLSIIVALMVVCQLVLFLDPSVCRDCTAKDAELERLRAALLADRGQPPL